MCARRRGVLAGFTAGGQSWRNMVWTGNKKGVVSLGICQNWKKKKFPCYKKKLLTCHESGSSSSSSSSVICQTTGPKPLPKRFLHIVRSRSSSFSWQYPLLSLRSSNSFLRLLPRLLVTSICPFIFPSITCCRRQFLRKMWPIQLAFHFLISCRSRGI